MIISGQAGRGGWASTHVDPRLAIGKGVLVIVIEFAEDARPYPKVIKCRGGWFAVEQKGELGSGPWRNEKAADAALKGDFSEAHSLADE